MTNLIDNRKLAYKSTIALSSLLLLATTLCPSLAFGAEYRGTKSINLGENDVVNDDLYALTGDFVNEGIISGDLLIMAGNVKSPGRITGDVMIIAGDVEVGGFVGGSLRILGGNVKVNANIIRDLVIVGGEVVVESGTSIGRDLLVGVGEADVSGSLNRHVNGKAGQLLLNGKVGGNVTINTGELVVGKDAQVNGSITLTSHNDPQVSPEAKIGGGISRMEPEQEGRFAWAKGLIIAAQALIGFFLLGLLFWLAAPLFNRKAEYKLRHSPWASLGIGLLILLGTPVVATLVIVIGAIIGGWWIGIIVLAIYLVAILLSFVVFAQAGGRAIMASLFKKPSIHTLLAVLIGLVILVLLAMIPLIGPLVVLAALLSGLGALLLGAITIRKDRELFRRENKPEAIAPPASSQADENTPVGHDDQTEDQK